MKTIYAFLFVAFCSILSTNLHAQSSTESYFLGKWNVTVKDVPFYGTVTLPARFEKNGASIKGFYTDVNTKEEKALDTVYMDADKLNFSFNYMGNDVIINLAKKDDNTATGLCMGTFDVEAVRVTGGSTYSIKFIPNSEEVKDNSILKMFLTLFGML